MTKFSPEQDAAIASLISAAPSPARGCTYLGVGIIRSMVIMPVEGKLGAMISASPEPGLRGVLSTNVFSVHDIGTESYEFCRGSSCRSFY